METKDPQVSTQENNLDDDKLLKLQKIIEYRNDPIKFFKEQCFIRHPKHGLIKFSVFFAQECCVKDFITHRFNIILKSRQLGISTIVAAYCLWKCIFFPHQEIRVVATKKETSQIIVKMTWDMLNNLVDPWILDVLGANKMSERKHSVELANGSKMQSHGQAKGENPDTGVGSALSLLVIDEAALIPNIKDVWTTIYPTLSQGGDCIVLSTPRGVDNWFYDMYTKAENKDYEVGEEPFHPTRLMWWENTDRIVPPHTHLIDDPFVIGGKANSWSRSTFANMTTKEIAQEYCCDFTMSGETALEPENIEYLRKNYKEDPIETQGSGKEFWIFRRPIEDRHYIISADVGKGDGSDYSAAQVIDVQNFEQVAEFKGKIPTDRFGQLLCKWGLDYNTALLIPENNNYGQATLQKIRDLQYPNLFWFDKRFKGLVFPELIEKGSEKREPGWITTSKTREPMLENLLRLLRATCRNAYDGLTIHSGRLISELQTWGYFGNNGRLEHARGKHDDLIMAIAIGAFVKAVYNRISETATKEAIEMMQYFSHSKNNADTSFGVNYGKSSKEKNPYDFNGNDISWLVK